MCLTTKQNRIISRIQPSAAARKSSCRRHPTSVLTAKATSNAATAPPVLMDSTSLPITDNGGKHTVVHDMPVCQNFPVYCNTGNYYRCLYLPALAGINC